MATQVQVTKWGNSLGVRVPHDMAARIGLTEGSRVDIESRGDHLVITKSNRRFTLEALLEGMTPDRQHPALDDAPRRTELL